MHFLNDFRTQRGYGGGGSARNPPPREWVLAGDLKKKRDWDRWEHVVQPFCAQPPRMQQLSSASSSLRICAKGMHVGVTLRLTPQRPGRNAHVQVV